VTISLVELWIIPGRFEGVAVVGDRGHRAAQHAVAVAPDDARGNSKGKLFLAQFLKAERRIFAYIMTLLPHRADAEDLLQQVSLIMWEKFDSQAPPEDFAAWGCRIAYFKIRDHRRTLRRSRVIFSDAMLDRVAQSLADRALELRLDERHEAMVRCLEKLQRRDRDLLAERFKEGATARSAAERIGLSPDAFYKSLARIRRLLDECVTRTLASEGRS
jgi:RNA polymerase sigma-70 factor (ECF subfamily)